MKKGEKMSEEQKIKIANSNKGKVITEEMKHRISQTLKLKGIKPPSRKGIQFSNEQKAKRSKLLSGSNNPMYGRRGVNSPNWRGGSSMSKYGKEWFGSLRRSIRERDGYVCQICNKQQDNKALSVHHIDYNKENCNPNNLISLCSVCHSKTNFNRDIWKKLFQNIIQKYQL